ncbi:MAG: hypothetical protein ABIQ81_04850 [Novosphingobium sp.]
MGKMGTVQKFKRPPKNHMQFQGYTPRRINGLGDKKRRLFRLRDWQASVAAWLALLMVTVGIWAEGNLLGGR